MNTQRKLNIALTTILGFSGIGAQAATLNNGDQLTIKQTGVYCGWYNSLECYGNQSATTPISYFGMDTDGNSKIAGTEKTALFMGTTGIVIGSTTSAGASHSGLPTAGDTNAITAPWGFFGNTGSDFASIAITGSTTAGLNFSGWTMTWSGLPATNMGTNAWGTGYSNGIANFTWSGIYGTNYTLDYAATVPIGDPSGLGGVKYRLHLEGIVNAAPAVPIPAATWLFGSGLLGLVGVARKKAA